MLHISNFFYAELNDIDRKRLRGLHNKIIRLTACSSLTLDW